MKKLPPKRNKIAYILVRDKRTIDWGGTNGELWRIMANYGEGFYGELGQTQLRNSP